MIASKLFTPILKNCIRGFSSSNTVCAPKIAIVLSGSGILDGTDVHETATALAVLSRNGAEFECYAPDSYQTHVKNHTKLVNAEVDPGDPRNMLSEAARVTRGNVKPLSELTSKVADAVIIPGGFGATSNLSDFYLFHSHLMCLEEDTTRVIEDFHAAKKPIGCSGLAGLLIAKTLGQYNVKVTVGYADDGSDRWIFGRHITGLVPFAKGEKSGGYGSCQVINSMWAKHVEKLVHEVCVDEKHKVVSTPGYMCACELHEIVDGTVNLVNKVVELTK